MDFPLIFTYSVKFLDGCVTCLSHIAINTTNCFFQNLQRRAAFCYQQTKRQGRLETSEATGGRERWAEEKDAQKIFMA